MTIISTLFASSVTAEEFGRDLPTLWCEGSLKGDAGEVSGRKPSARVEKSIREMLAEEAERDPAVHNFNSDISNKFLPDYKGILAGPMANHNLVILGAGSNLYNGFLSLKYRLSYLMGVSDKPEKGFFIYDPAFLEKSAQGQWIAKESAKKDHPNATILTSMNELPENAVVITLTPNAVHERNLEDLALNSKVQGIYMEKPIAVSVSELALIDQVVKRTSIPIYFGDHYLHAGGSLPSIMGLPMPDKNTLEITLDPTGALSEAVMHGTPVLKEVTGIEGRNLQEGSGLSERPLLRQLSAGGGVGPDLQVHMTTFVHSMGFEFRSIDRVHEWVYSAEIPGQGNYVPIQQAHRTKPDAAADMRVISGRTRNGANYRFVSAQFAPRPENTLTLIGDGGKKLKVDFESGTTEYFDSHGQKIGEICQRADAYLLTMYNAIEMILSGRPEAFQLPQQKASVREALAR